MRVELYPHGSKKECTLKADELIVFFSLIKITFLYYIALIKSVISELES